MPEALVSKIFGAQHRSPSMAHRGAAILAVDQLLRSGKRLADDAGSRALGILIREIREHATWVETAPGPPKPPISVPPLESREPLPDSR